MNHESKQAVLTEVYNAGDLLKHKMPENSERNSYAHIFHEIKEQFGDSYKNLPDSAVPEILQLICKIKNELA